MTAPVPSPASRADGAIVAPGRRSLSVSVIAAMGIVGGVLGTFAAVAGLLLHPSVQAALAITAGPVGLFAAWGLWRRREWARQSTIGVMALSIGYLLLLLAFPSILDRQAGVPVHLGRLVIGQLVFYGVVNLLIMAKLLTRRVREEFEAAD